MRKKIVETGDVDVMISIRSNFFYTRPVPCELWFFDKAKPATDAHVQRFRSRPDLRPPAVKVEGSRTLSASRAAPQSEQAGASSRSATASS